MTSTPADSPRYAVVPALQFDFCVQDMTTGDRVSDILSRADATALADTMNTVALTDDTGLDLGDTATATYDGDCASL